MLTFSVEEYKERLAKVKADMEKKGMDVLILSDASNINYVSGYDGLSYYVPQVVVVALELEKPFCIVRFQDGYAATVTTWMGEENIFRYPDKYLWEPKEVYVYDFVADVIKEKKLDKKRIGVEMDAYYYTHFCHMNLSNALPDATFVNATALVNWIRGPKSPKELEYMQIAARICERTMNNAINTIHSGVRENLVGANIMRDQALGTDYFGGESISLPPIIAAGDRTQAAHFTWQTEAEFQKDQLVYMELAGCYRRYHAPLSRTIYIGTPPDQLRKAAEVVIEGLNVALDTIKEGVTCEEVEAAWQRTINKHGLFKESRMGYAIGLSYAPVWTENSAYCRPGEKAVMKENMTFHMMPGIWLDGFGMAVTETIRVMKNGCETITKFPRKLFLAD